MVDGSIGRPGKGSARRTALRLLAWLPVAMLAACATPQERAAQARAEVEEMMVVYGPACTHMGYAAQSDAWRSCVLNLDTRAELRTYDTGPGYYAGWGPGYWRQGGWWGR